MNPNRRVDTTEALARRYAIATGVLFLITHVTSIGALVLYGPIANNPGYITGPGPDTQVLLGVFFEIILAMAAIGTAVALFPVVKRQNEGIALGYVGLRTLEGAIIAVGVVPLLAIVALRQQLAVTAGAGAAGLVTLGGALLELHDFTFLLGPGFIVGVHTVPIAYLLYRSRLVPRFIPVLGLIGGPLVFVTAIGVLFGIVPQGSVWTFVTAMPALAWELSLALWLIIKGFNRAALASGSAQADMNQSVSGNLGQAKK